MKFNLMNEMNKFGKKVIYEAKKHEPELWAGSGIAFGIATVYFACKGTLKAAKKIEEAKGKKVIAKTTDGENIEIKNNLNELTNMDIVKLVYKDYIPAAITGVASIACTITSVERSCRKSAILATAYRLSEEAAAEYRQKVIETIGEKKEQKLREDIAQDKINNNPVQSTQVFLTNQGNALCYDTYSGRYFKFDIDKLKKINNEINERLLMDNQVSLNEIYLEYGLDGIDMGYEMGWSSDGGLIDFQLTSKLTKDDEPCLVISFNPAPQPGYAYFYK